MSKCISFFLKSYEIEHIYPVPISEKDYPFAQFLLVKRTTYLKFKSKDNYQFNVSCMITISI